MQRLEKILKEIKEMLEDNKVIELNSDGTIDKCVIDAKLAWDYIKDIIRKHINDGWISVEKRLPDVTEGTEDPDCPEFNVMIKGASRSTTLKYSWDGTWFNDNGYLYDVIAWQPLPEPYRPEEKI